MTMARCPLCGRTVRCLWSPGKGERLHRHKVRPIGVMSTRAFVRVPVCPGSGQEAKGVAGGASE